MEDWKKQAIAMGIGQMSDSMDFVSGMMIIPLLIQLWGLGIWELTLIGMIGSVGMLMSGFTAGAIADLFGRRKVWILFNLTAGISLIASAFSPNWIVYALLRAIASYSLASTHACFYVLLPETIPTPDIRQTVTSLVTVLHSSGELILSVMLALTGVFPWLTWQLFLFLAGAVDIAAVLTAVPFVKESPLWLERRKLLKEGKLPKEEQKKVSYRGLLSREFLVPALIGMTLAYTFGMASLTNATFGMSSYYWMTFVGLTPAFIGVIETIARIVYIPTRAAMGFISDRIGRLNTLIIFGLFTLVASQIFWRVHLILGTGETTSILILIVVTYWMYMFSTRCQEETPRMWMAEVFPTNVRATIISFFESYKTIIGMPIGLITGYLAAISPSPWNIWAAFPIIGIVLGTTVALIAKKKGMETKGRMLK